MKADTIIVAPLNWGIGHATRCIPIIEHIIDLNLKVVIASDGEALVFLKKRFPNLDFFELASYKIKYGRKHALSPLLFRWPLILKALFLEHRQIQKLKDKYNCIGIISDNRLCCYSKSTKSIYITHQTKIKTPNKLLDILSNWVHNFFMLKFNEVWIPDFNSKFNLSGELSTGLDNLNVRFIGPQTRFTNKLNSKKSILRDFAVVLSGIEPQKSIFEKEISLHLEKGGYSYLIINGNQKKSNTTGILNSTELQKEILNSKYIISRSGYSSIMDWYGLKTQAILIPTPGQTEQEYLSNHLKDHPLFVHQMQGKINLTKAITQLKEKKNIKIKHKKTYSLNNLLLETFTSC